MTAESLRTVAQLAKELPAFDEAAIRRLIFNSQENGLAHAIVHIGRNVFIDIRDFNRWLDERRGTPRYGRPRLTSARQRR